VLEFERSLELLGFDDRVDAQLAGVALVGRLQRSLAPLEQPSCRAVHEGRRRREHHLHGCLVVVRGQQGDERLREGVLVVPRGLDR
jgi:hypothetical protein